jgi:hypothetical protein
MKKNWYQSKWVLLISILFMILSLYLLSTIKIPSYLIKSMYPDGREMSIDARTCDELRYTLNEPYLQRNLFEYSDQTLIFFMKEKGCRI